MGSGIVSVSRRTDIPAFYAEWFINRVRAGKAAYNNPYDGREYVISLQSEHAPFFVFWTRNPEPLTPHLDELDDRGYRFYFHFTITGYPSDLESAMPTWERAVEIAHKLARRYSPRHMLWRFDPILFSSWTPPERILENFARLCAALEGATHVCVFSFANYYGKVFRNLSRLRREKGGVFRAPEESRNTIDAAGMDGFVFDLSRDERVAFAKRLAEIAAGHRIAMRSCCGDYLASDSGAGIRKAQCVDPILVSELLGRPISGKKNPTRPGCGCWESKDIGAYDTCAHGCVYCYANARGRNCAQKEANADGRLHLGKAAVKKMF